MKASLVSLWCFALKLLHQKTLALPSIRSVLFRCAYELLSFGMRREGLGIEIFHRSHLRENSGSMAFVKTKKRSSRLPRDLKVVYYVKESSSWMISSVSKEEVICVRVHSHGITRSKYYGAITKRMNFNCPVAETSESIEPNDNNLELNAIAYTFSKIDSNLNFNNSFGDRELLASVSLVSPPKRTRKLKERTLSLLWKIPLCCGGIQEHKNA